jgi:hypothetical protein
MNTSIIKSHRRPAGVPRVRRTDDNPSEPSKGHSHFMMVCCALMVVGVGVVFATAPAASSWSETMGLALPLLGCLGVHLVMHRFMGRSCHKQGNEHGLKDRASEQNNTNIRKVD